MLRFDDRVVLITGAGRGIGREHALYFARLGAKVIVNDNGTARHGGQGRDPVPAQAVAQEIQQAGGIAIDACCDITDSEQVLAMVADVTAKFGRIDVVVHNASVYAPLSSFAESSLADVARIFRVNVHGAWNVLQATWESMAARGYGRVVLTGSGAGFFGRRKDHGYSVAKGALMTLTKLLATEGETSGIKTNLIGPVAWTDNAKAQSMPALMEHFAPPVMVSHVVAALSHEDCPVNGEMFHCGGGFVARVFVGETLGTVFTPETMTPEAVVDAMRDITDTRDFLIPANSDRSGAHLSASIAAVNPGFAAALAAAKASR